MAAVWDSQNGGAQTCRSMISNLCSGRVPLPIPGNLILANRAGTSVGYSISKLPNAMTSVQMVRSPRERGCAALQAAAAGMDKPFPARAGMLLLTTDTPLEAPAVPRASRDACSLRLSRVRVIVRLFLNEGTNVPVFRARRPQWPTSATAVEQISATSAETRLLTTSSAATNGVDRSSDI